MAKMIYPHVTNSTAAVNRYEPVVSSNFNAHFILLNNLKAALGDFGFLSEYIKNIGNLFVEKSEGDIEAGYKITKFKYDSNEVETFFETEAAFFNFLDNDSRMLVYNALLLWSRFKYNMLTGEKTLKRDYADANIVAERFNRDGTLYWRRMTHGTFLKSNINDMPADYTAHDMTEITVTFNSDWVTDVTNDPRLVIPE
jgi:hypothetical protein